jgi:aminoglycoside phosphotransferase (APT) family kinase protein
MRDLSAFLVPPGESLIRKADNEGFLDAMASMHVAFWEGPEAADPALGYSRLELDYTCLTPETGRREAGGSDPVPRMLVEGWDVLLTTVEPDIAEALVALARDPAPLCEALRAFPQTVVHADWKLGNLGLMPNGSRGSRAQTSQRVVLLDWARVLAAPPLVDLAWYLAVNCVRLPLSKEETISCYRQCLESRLAGRLDEQQWQIQIDLSLLGSFLQLGWSKALGAVRGSSEEVRRREAAELAWWSERVLPAIDRL